MNRRNFIGACTALTTLWSSAEAADTPAVAQQFTRPAPPVTSADQVLDVMSLEPLARDALPPAHYGYLATGADDDRGLGATLRLPVANSPAVDLFGESPSRLVVSCRPRHAPALTLLARQHGLAVEELGTVGGERLVVDLAGAGATGAAEERGSRVADALDVGLTELRHAWDTGLTRALGWENG